jgi:hypothetical protein
VGNRSAFNVTGTIIRVCIKCADRHEVKWYPSKSCVLVWHSEKLPPPPAINGTILGQNLQTVVLAGFGSLLQRPLDFTTGCLCFWSCACILCVYHSHLSASSCAACECHARRLTHHPCKHLLKSTENILLSKLCPVSTGNHIWYI